MRSQIPVQGSGFGDFGLAEWVEGVTLALGTPDARVMPDACQSNRLETDSSVAVRPIASPISVAIDMTLMLRAVFTAWVG